MQLFNVFYIILMIPCLLQYSCFYHNIKCCSRCYSKRHHKIKFSSFITNSYLYRFNNTTMQYIQIVLAQSTLGTRFTTNTSIDRSGYAKIHFKLFHIPSLAIETINLCHKYQNHNSTEPQNRTHCRTLSHKKQNVPHYTVLALNISAKSPETCMLNPGNLFSPKKHFLENKPLKRKTCSTICSCRFKKCRPFIINRSIKVTVQKQINQNNSVIILSTIIVSKKLKTLSSANALIHFKMLHGKTLR